MVMFKNTRLGGLGGFVALVSCSGGRCLYFPILKSHSMQSFIFNIIL